MDQYTLEELGDGALSALTLIALAAIISWFLNSLGADLVG